MKSLGLILSLGMIGVLCRYQLSLLGARLLAPAFPWMTFGINLLGSFLIGLISVWGGERFFNSEIKVALMIGLLGGFTTFSAYSLETIRLFERGMWLEGVSYAILSPILGIALCYTGIFLAR